MRQISDGHEIRPRGGLLLVTTLHFYLHRYFPVAIDRSIREHSFLENLHMGNQGVSDLLRRPASGHRAAGSQRNASEHFRLNHACVDSAVACAQSGYW